MNLPGVPILRLRCSPYESTGALLDASSAPLAKISPRHLGNLR